MKSALIIGIDDYPQWPLNFCVRDAKDVGQILGEAEYEFETELITDGDASARRLRKSIEGLLASQPDVALIYFAGHGIVTDMGGFLLTPDWPDLTTPG